MTLILCALPATRGTGLACAVREAVENIDTAGGREFFDDIARRVERFERESAKQREITPEMLTRPMTI